MYAVDLRKINEERLPVKALDWTPPGRKKAGRPRNFNWIENEGRGNEWSGKNGE